MPEIQHTEYLGAAARALEPEQPCHYGSAAATPSWSKRLGRSRSGSIFGASSLRNSQLNAQRGWSSPYLLSLLREPGSYSWPSFSWPPRCPSSWNGAAVWVFLKWVLQSLHLSILHRTLFCYHRFVIATCLYGYWNVALRGEAKQCCPAWLAMLAFDRIIREAVAVIPSLTTGKWSNGNCQHFQ